MHVTRPLSMYKRFPELLSAPPLEGPHSGYLVVLDIEEAESETTCCFGSSIDNWIGDLPFPQNKDLTITYDSGHDGVSYNKVFLIPVLSQPLSSNRYYVIQRHGKHKGEAYANSREEDMATFLCCSCVEDVEPKPLDPSDIYHRVEIFRKRNGFSAKSTAPDGIPPRFLWRKGWRVRASIPQDYQLDEAPGLDSSLRSRLPDFNFPLSYNSSGSVGVGKWYCPFMFVKEEMKLKDQMKRSVFYEMTLEQRWDKIFSSDSNIGGEREAVFVDAVVQKEVVFVAGREAVWDEKNVADGVVWYKSFDSGGGEVRVGLSREIVERIKWEQEIVGWEGGDARQVRVERVEEFGRIGGWKKFGGYVLVERFVLKRMDRSLVLTYDFKHTHQIRSKWE